MNINEISSAIIGAAIEVHRELGPGLLESAYETCLAREFDLRGIPYLRQVPVPVLYKGEKLDCGYRLDFLVQDAVIVEVKSVEKLIPVHDAQVLTYLRLMKCKLGILLNFNAPMMTGGIKRLALNL